MLVLKLVCKKVLLQALHRSALWLRRKGSWEDVPAGACEDPQAGQAYFSPSVRTCIWLVGEPIVRYLWLVSSKSHKHQRE